MAAGMEKEERSSTNPYALHRAAAYGNVLLVRELLNAGIDVNTRDENGLTPLHIAALNGHEEALKTLLAMQGINVNSATDKDLTPLDMALQKNNAPLIKSLLLHGAHIRLHEEKGIIANLFGKTGIKPHDQAVKVLQKIFENQPLILAAILNNWTEIQKLLRYRPDQKKINQALCYAIAQGHCDSVECLIDALDAISHEIFVHLGLIQKQALTPELKKIYERIRSLLYRSVKKRELCPICKDQLGSEKLAILACSHAFHKECIDPWLKQDINSKCPQCVAVLKDIDMNALDRQLFVAIAKKGKLPEIQVLLLKGAHPHTEHFGKTAFTLAALLGRADIVRMLLEYAGINPVRQLQECLMGVIQEIIKSNKKKHYDVLRTLLEAGAIVDPCKDDQVRAVELTLTGNPLALCGVWGNVPEIGALTNPQSDIGMVRDALRFAIGQGHGEIVNVILQQFKNFESGFIHALLENAKILFERSKKMAEELRLKTDYSKELYAWYVIYQERYTSIVKILRAVNDHATNNTDMISLSHDLRSILLETYAQVTPQSIIHKVDHQLFIAIENLNKSENKNLQEIVDLLRMGADCNYEERGMTPLAIAVSLGRAEAVRLLLHSLATNPIKRLQECLSRVAKNVLIASQKGLLREAEEYGETLLALIEGGAIIEHENNDHKEAVKTILHGQPLLLFAICGDSLEVKKHIEVSGFRLLKEALLYAIAQGHSEVVQVILQNGGDFAVDEFLVLAKILFERSKKMAAELLLKTNYSKDLYGQYIRYQKQYNNIIEILSANKPSILHEAGLIFTLNSLSQIGQPENIANMKIFQEN